MDIVLYSGGAVGYNDIMTMPLPSIQILVQQMNKKAEDMKAASSRRR